MTCEHEASRTLVKSPPELWAELSHGTSLARHLNDFGEIRITRLEPETAVAWEGDRASGTARLEPAGWGTRVILTARAALVEVPAPPSPMPPIPGPDPTPPAPGPDPTPPAPGPDPGLPAPVPDPSPLPPAARQPGMRRMLVRVLRWFGLSGAPEAPGELPGEPAGEPASPAATPPDPEPVGRSATLGSTEPLAAGSPGTQAILASALDSLGRAHHRPFSRT